MELQALNLLLVVAEQASFTRAATKMGMTQSALSRQVQRLEKEFNTRLFYRNGRGVELTEAGEKLRSVGRQIFRSIDDLKEELSLDSSSFRGVVTIGLPPSLGSTVSAALVRRFQHDFPEAKLRVVVAFSGALTEWLEAGRIDVAVLYDARRSATLLVTPLLEEPLYLVEPPPGSDPSSPAKLSELGVGRFVMPSSENGMRRIVDATLSRLGLRMHIAAEVDSLDATKELVATGTERCILPLGAIHRERKAGQLIARPFDNPQMQALLVLATPLHKPITRLATAVLRLVEKEVVRCVEEGILSGVTGPALRKVASLSADASAPPSDEIAGLT